MGRHQRGESRLVWRALGRTERLLLIALACTVIVQGGVTMALPLLVKALLDVAMPSRDAGLAQQLFWGMLAAPVVAQVVSAFNRLVAGRVGYRMLGRLQVSLFEHVLGLPRRFFTSSRGGQLRAGLSEEFVALRERLVGAGLPWLLQLVNTIAAAGVLLILDVRHAVYGIVVAPVCVAVAIAFGRLQRSVDEREREVAHELRDLIHQAVSPGGSDAVKTLDAAPRLVARARELVSRGERLLVRRDVLVRVALLPPELCTPAILAFLYRDAALGGTGGDGPSIGALVVFAGVFMSFLAAGQILIERSLEVMSLPVDFARVLSPFQQRDELTAGTVDLPSPVRGEVRLDGVWFRYEPGGRDALRDVSLTVPAGSRVVIVGRNGAGKTTLGSLVARLFDPDRGRVLIDGVDLRDLSTDCLRRTVGVVSQETFLFHGSIRDNLLLASPEATQAQLEAACREARIHDQIIALPRGYEAPVGEGGHRLSGGQRQRLAIARTILRDPRVLVLDEPTSEVDSVTERELDAQLGGLGKGRTTIVIAHRLSTIRPDDRVVVLADGEVVEADTHRELLAAGGHYTELAGWKRDRSASSGRDGEPDPIGGEEVTPKRRRRPTEPPPSGDEAQKTSPKPGECGFTWYQRLVDQQDGRWNRRVICREPKDHKGGHVPTPGD